MEEMPQDCMAQLPASKYLSMQAKTALPLQRETKPYYPYGNILANRAI
jgi:hypothetical protein